MFMQKKMMKFEGMIFCDKNGNVKLYRNEKQANASAEKNVGKVFTISKPSANHGIKTVYYVVK